MTIGVFIFTGLCKLQGDFQLYGQTYFIKLDKLAPGKSMKKQERAKVGQSLPLRGVPVSGWVSNTLRECLLI